MNKEILYKNIERLVPPLVPLAQLMRKLIGRAGARLLPIVEYSHLGLPAEINRDWAILDTFDMYSPSHDHPQTFKTVKRWFSEAGFSDSNLRFGPNGVVGKGKKPNIANKEGH